MHSLVVHNVSFTYDETIILKDVDFEINANDFTAIIGPSGCGKSTLLRLLAGLSQPDTGRIISGDREIIGPGLDRAVVFQDYSLFPWMSCGENIILALSQSSPSLKRRQARPLAEEYLNMVGLEGEFDKLPGELSGGMKQRAAIARSFAINAPVLLMDEPFGALDAITRARLQDLLLDMWQTGGNAGKTVVFVTHDVEEALILANRILIMGVNPGRIVKNIEVTLPRPRSRQKSLGDADFQRLRGEVLRELDQVILMQMNSSSGNDGGGI